MLKVPFNIIIKESIKRTKTILFTDFSSKKWLKLLFIAYLAGSITTSISGGSNFSPKDFIRDKSKQKEEKPISTQLITLKESGKAASYSYLKQTDFQGKFFIQRKNFSSRKDDLFQKIKNNNFWILGLLFSFLLFLALLILLIWLQARFKFIWFNSILNNTSEVVQPFKKYKKEGNSLFRALTLFSAGALIFILLIAWWIYPKINNLLLISQPREIISLIFSFMVPAGVFILGMIIFWLIFLFINQFIVALMAKKRSRFMPALRDLFRIVNSNKKEFLFYILLVAGLLILTSLLSLALLIAVLLVALLIVGAFLGLFYLIIVMLLKAKLIYFIFLALIGIPFLFVIFFLLISVKLPFATFYRSFSLYFLSNLENSLIILPIEGDRSKSK